MLPDNLAGYRIPDSYRIPNIRPDTGANQDVTTRWNSTFYMLDRIVEQEAALVQYGSTYDEPAGAQLSVDQRHLIKKV